MVPRSGAEVRVFGALELWRSEMVFALSSATPVWSVWNSLTSPPLARQHFLSRRERVEEITAA